MPRRFWLSAVSLGLAFLSSNLTATPAQKHVAPTTSSNGRQLTIDVKPNAFTVIKGDLHEIASSLKTIATKKPDEDSPQRSANAEEWGSRWALGMLIVASLETAITALGVFLVFKTLGYTRNAANAARATVEESKRTADAAEHTLTDARASSERELRAYLSVEPAGINQMIGSANTRGHVKVTNVGKVPAQSVSVNVQMFMSGNENEPLPNGRPDSLSVMRGIQPTAHMRQGSGEALPVSEVIKPGKYVFVWGTVRYSDGLTTERRFTNFCHRYPTAGYNRHIDPRRISNETQTVIETGKARYHTYGNDSY